MSFIILIQFFIIMWLLGYIGELHDKENLCDKRCDRFKKRMEQFTNPE